MAFQGIGIRSNTLASGCSGVVETLEVRLNMMYPKDMHDSYVNPWYGPMNKYQRVWVGWASERED